MVENRDWSGCDPVIKTEFEACVKFGMAIFNIIMSLMPPRVLKMAEMVGFSGDKVHVGGTTRPRSR